MGTSQRAFSSRMAWKSRQATFRRLSQADAHADARHRESRTACAHLARSCDTVDLMRQLTITQRA